MRVGVIGKEGRVPLENSVEKTKSHLKKEKSHLKNEEIVITSILTTLSQLYFKGVEDEFFIEVWEELPADDSAKTFLAYCNDKTYLPEEFIAMLGRWLWVCLKKDLIKFNYSSEEIDSTFAFSIGEAIEELWKNKEERNNQIVG